MACSLARHAANGWSDAGLPADYQALEDLLHLNKYEALRKLGVLESALDGMSIADKQEQDK